MKKLCVKLNSRRGGINRLVLIFILAIIAMLVVIAIPWIHEFRLEADRAACETAMKSASDGLAIEYMDTFKQGSLKQAQQTIDQVMPGREENICPTGGTVYLILQDNGVYKPVCGLHDRDEQEKTRLNATYVKQQLEGELTKLKKEGQEVPDTIIIKVNGKDLPCERVEDLPAIRSGTSKMVDYDGVIAFFTADDKGNLGDFLYADEAYYAKSVRGGWWGDAYS